MASRKKFVIPSESEVKDTNTDLAKQFSKFKSFKLNKDQNEVHTTEQKQVVPTTFKPTFQEDIKSTSSDAQNTSSKISKASTFPSTSSLVASSTTVGPGRDSSAVSESAGPPSASSSNIPAPGTFPSATKPASSNSIIVNYRQRGNPVLKHIRNVAWEYGSIIPDYVMGIANCALFLSLRYHQLHPEYLHNRLKELGKGYDLRVLLVQVDIKEPHNLLKDLAKICILADMTLILAFSAEEVGRYLEAYKVYENKPAEALMEKTETDFVSQLTECLTTVKSVNKTDCMTLLSSFKSMDGIINASRQDITCCAGFGPQKAQRIYDVFHEPFLKCRKRQNDLQDNNKDHSPAKKTS